MPKVDIIIPAYNQGHYLRDSVESALAQTWENIEVIIVDDGSTDNTAEVGQSFDDHRVTYIYKENGGLSAARNTGLEHVTGEYVSFLDSDDRFLPKKIELLLKKLDEYPRAGLAAGPAQLIDSDGEPIGRNYGKGIPDLETEWLYGNRIHVGSVLIKTAWLKKVEPFDEGLRACEDWDMWLRLSIAGCDMLWVETPVSQYRMHGQQMTKEALRMKTAMIMVLDKTFERDDLKPSWKQAGKRAKAEALIKAAGRAFLADEPELAKTDLAEAIQFAPELKDQHGAELMARLVGWAFTPSCTDPYEYVSTVFNNLPPELNMPLKVKKAELGKVAVNLAFDNFSHGNKALTRKYAMRAIKAAPHHLFNRGLFSIYLQSLLPR